jgi:hypothetical protein
VRLCPWNWFYPVSRKGAAGNGVCRVKTSGPCRLGIDRAFGCTLGRCRVVERRVSWFCSISVSHWGFLVWAVCLECFADVGNSVLECCCMLDTLDTLVCLVCSMLERLNFWGSASLVRVRAVPWHRIALPSVCILVRYLAVGTTSDQVRSSRLVVLPRVRVSVPCPGLRVVHGLLALGCCSMRFLHSSELCCGLTYGVVAAWSWSQVVIFLFRFHSPVVT